MLDNLYHSGKPEIAPLSITGIYDGTELIGYEFSNGGRYWCYDFNQDLWPGMRLGKFPPKSIDREYQRVSLNNTIARMQEKIQQADKMLVELQNVLLDLQARIDEQARPAVAIHVDHIRADWQE